jgi:hypothetical protein
MKAGYLLFIFILAGITSCDKPSLVPPDTLVTDLTITQVVVPLSVSQNQPLTSTIRMTGANQCFRFSHFEVFQQNPTLFDVRAKATIPNPDRGTVVCQPPVYTKDTILSIPVHLTGKHVLRFYNGPQLFETDTVQVN